MNAIEFVVRTGAGSIQPGWVGGEGQSNTIVVDSGTDISLNFHQDNLRGLARVGDNLEMVMPDGQVIVIDGYFVGNGEAANQLFFSTGGELTRVQIIETGGGALFAQYHPMEMAGKWTPDSELVFLDDGALIAPGDDEVSMLAAPLLGPVLGGGGAAGLLAVPFLFGGGGGGGGGGGDGDGWPDPTVDDADASFTYNASDTAEISVTGTAQPGSAVQVVIGSETVTTTSQADGTWEAMFDGTDFPDDGTYDDIVVTVTEPDGTVTVLDGPSYLIDTVPPVIDFDSGTVGAGDLFNAVAHAGGVSVTGTTELGATLTITVGTDVQTVTAAADGSWSVDFSDVTLPEGEYLADITVVAVDAVGNSTTATDQIEIDTVPNPLTIDTVTTDDLVNAAEVGAGFDITGTTAPGGTVSVTFNGTTTDVVADAAGLWTLPVAAGAVPGGEYDTTITATTTDAAGNPSDATHDVEVDTVVELSFDTSSVAGDGIINAVELAGGVVLSGTGSPGATITLEIDDGVAPIAPRTAGISTAASTGPVLSALAASFSTTVAADGSWSVTVPASAMPSGSDNITATATATDDAGNTTSQSGRLVVDTDIFVTVDTATVETDGVVNAVERSDGVTLGGTTEAGATVDVTLGTTTRTVTANADGTWAASFTAAEVASGEVMMPVSVTATDAAGNVATTSDTLDVDTFVRDFAMTSTPGGADGIINAAEAAQGVTLTGTVEPGSTLQITLGAVTVAATVDRAGNWTAVFDPAQLPSGETTVALTAVATDPAGNTETLSRLVEVDTLPGMLTISPAPVEGDDIVNAAEASDGVIITGTSDPGQAVDVTLAGVTRTVTTASNGVWIANFTSAEVAPGTYTADITATITDRAGNTLTRTDSVEVDTEVLNFNVNGPITADNVVNAAERLTGVTLSGTTEPGGSVQVEVGGVMRMASVDALGNWSLPLAAGDLNGGTEYNTSFRVVTTDAAGNTAQDSADFRVDTVVNDLSMTPPALGGDRVLNFAELSNPLTLSGTVEPGSTVSVLFNGVQYTAQVTANGIWSTTVPPGSLPEGTLTAPITVTATDAAGNTRTLTDSIEVDTDIPAPLEWEGYGRNHLGVDEVRTDITTDEVSIGRVVTNMGSTSIEDVAISGSTDIPSQGVTYHALSNVVPDGSHLVLSVTDAAGNTSGSYLVTDNPGVSSVVFTDQLANALTDYNVEVIDLEFDEDASLTITEDQVAALSNATDTLVIKGGADDSVTLAGGVATSAGTVNIDGHDYNAYAFGSTTVLIDDDITNVNGVI